MSDESNPQMAQALLDAMETMTPVLDAADGLRANLEQRGWSPTGPHAARVLLTEERRPSPRQPGRDAAYPATGPVSLSRAARAAPPAPRWPRR